VNFPPTVAISRLVNSLKGVSSRRLRQEFPDLRQHYWRAGEAPVVRVVLRRIGRRGTYLCPAPVHRTAGPAVLTGSCPPAFTTGLKAGALAAILVA